MSDTTDTGGPAFPQTNDAWFGSDGNPTCPSGMTLRDYFAGQALAGNCGFGSGSTTADDLVCEAYSIADAMLKARGQ